MTGFVCGMMIYAFITCECSTISIWIFLLLGKSFNSSANSLSMYFLLLNIQIGDQ